jgi:hypothetical protein
MHHSKARVEFSRNILLLNFFEVISGQKNLKNNVKICRFISPHGDAILKKIKMRLNACIILLLLVYLIGTIFSVNLKY